MSCFSYNRTIEPPNNIRRLLVFGDIHGYYNLFTQQLRILEFNPQYDWIISVGDIIDRGDGSVQMLQLAMNEKWFYMVRGNHEQMLLDVILPQDSLTAEKQLTLQNLWFLYGGRWSLECDSALLVQFAKMIKQLPFTLTIKAFGKTYGVAHADPMVDDWDKIDSLLLDEQNRKQLLMNRTPAHLNIRNVDASFHGHVPHSEPLKKNNCYFLDSGVFESQKFFVAEITKDEIKI